MLIANMIRLANANCENVPSFIFEAAMVDAARYYFDKTHSWIESGVITTIPQQNTYILDSSDVNEKSIISIKSIKDENSKIERFDSLLRNQFRLYQVPTSAKELHFEVVIRPAWDATEIPNDVFEQNQEALKYGVIFELKKQRNTDWHDPQGAVDFENKFERAISAKKLEIATAYNPNTFNMAI